MTSARNGIVPLDPTSRDDVRTVARLHAQLLPGSPLSKLGEAFMADFYYRHLVRDCGLRCDVAFANGVPLGFLAYTAEPGFLGLGLRRHFWSLTISTLRAVLSSPARVLVILRMVSAMGVRSAASAPGRHGELLSLGVVPAHRRTGSDAMPVRHVARELTTHAMDNLAAEGAESVHLLAEADNNRAARLFTDIGFTPSPIPGTATVKFTATVKPRSNARTV